MEVPNTSKITLHTYNLIFIFINIFLVLDFGYIKYPSKSIQVTANVFRVIHSAIVLVGMSLYTAFEFDQYVVLAIFRYTTFNLQFLTCIFVSNFSDKQKSFCSFQNNLITIDRELGVSSAVYNVELKFIIMFTLSLIAELSTLIYFCFFTAFCNIPSYFMFSYCCPKLVATVVLFVYAFVFYSSYCRMKTLTSLASRPGNDCNHILHIYRQLANMTDEGRSNFSCMFFWVFMSYMSFMMVTTFYPILIQLNSEEPKWDVLVTNVIVVPRLFALFAPVYTASLLASQVQELKLMLYSRLINERDEAHYAGLQKFIHYIEARPFTYCIADILPLDWSLVTIVLNVIITYVIVLLQMSTHK